jgi:hypothetical protein
MGPLRGGGVVESRKCGVGGVVKAENGAPEIDAQNRGRFGERERLKRRGARVWGAVEGGVFSAPFSQVSRLIW